LFKHFAGIDAVDVEIDSENVDEIVRTVELISGTYGGINLEDFKAPECFEIEERLKKKLGIPVFHDDQHGTAIVVGAGLLNALRVAGKSVKEVRVVINGAGAAGVAIGRMLKAIGVLDVVMCDSRGVISKDREGLYKSKVEFASDFKGSLADVVKGTDVFIGVSAKDVLSVEMLLSMSENRIVFALANPDPEIGWDVAHEACDDVIMATGRSDFPNQVNNVLAFPGIFRGALDCRAKEISEEMKVAAVDALAGLCDGDKIIPDVFDERIVIEVAVAVAGAAEVEGFDLDEYRDRLKRDFLKGEDDLIRKRFRHFKGGEYVIVAIGRDDDLKKVVVYRGDYDSEEFGRGSVWVRGYDEFFGEVEVDGKIVKRFEEV